MNKYFKYLLIPVICGLIICVNFGSVDAVVSIENPVRINSVDDLLAKTLSAVQSIIAALAVLFIVIGGVIYITSAGDQQRVELAKKAVTASLIGLALALAAPAFLKEIYEVLGADAPNNAPAVTKTLSEIVVSTIKVLASIVGSLSVLMLVVGGIMYMTAMGDTQKSDTAKNVIKYAVIGLIVAILALIIVTQVIDIFQ
jgi:hypothetical protein